MRTSFDHQPEAQHPKIFSYPQAGPADYPILARVPSDIRNHAALARRGTTKKLATCTGINFCGHNGLRFALIRFTFVSERGNGIEEAGYTASHAGVASSFPGGFAPVDPQTSEAALQTEFVKFRLRPDQKVRLMQAASDGDTSVSAILRHAALALAAGRELGSSGRTDLVAMRRAANELAAAVEATTTDPDGTMVRILETIDKIPEPPAAMTAKAKAERLIALEAELLQCEREEEALVEASEEGEGPLVARRLTASGLAVLCLGKIQPKAAKPEGKVERVKAGAA